jgi:hypothetical protein
MKYKKIRVYKNSTNIWKYTIETLPLDKIKTKIKPNTNLGVYYYSVKTDPSLMEDERAFYELKLRMLNVKREEINRKISKLHEELVNLHYLQFKK